MLFRSGDQDSLADSWHDGFRLRGMVARTDDLAATVARAPDLFGVPMQVSRGERTWQFAVRPDGKLPMDGAVPHLMDWGTQGPAGPHMPDMGCKLIELVLETPAPDVIDGIYQRIALSGAPKLRFGPRPKLMAVIETPTGIHLLT